MEKKPRSIKALRVAVAKDVLGLLRKGMNAEAGRYLRMGDRAKDVLWEMSSKEVAEALPRQVKHCDVCAKGAMLLAYVHMWDGMDFGELARCDVNSKTQELFGPEQADLIEAAFEAPVGASYQPISADRRAVCAAQVFGARYPDAKARLRAIMNNIIKNEGVFVPPIPKELVNGEI